MWFPEELPGAIELYLLEGKIRNGSDFGLKLKYLENELLIRKLVSVFILRR